MNTKRSLLTSSVALLLCFVMLLGTTYAWFTDSVTSSGNKIQSGTLKLDLLVLKEGTNNDWYSIKDESKPLFTYENWEPGYTDVSILKVKNSGNLALKWVAKLFSENALSDLAKVIDVYVLPGATEYPTDRAALEGWNKVGTLDGFINSISTTTYGTLEGGDEATLGIAFKMQETAGNEYQGMTLGDFDIRIVATQLTSEDDSFGPDYDTDSEYPADPLYFSAGTDIADSDLLHGATNVQITIGDDSSDVSAVLPEGVKLADGAKSVKLTVKSADTNSNISLGEGESALSFDVHIDGIAADNQQPMIVNLGAILEAGLTDTELKLVHVENSALNQMSRVNSASDFATHNQYTYNEATGEVSIYVKSFSVFSAVNGTASKLTAETVADTSWYVGHENDTEYTLNSAAAFIGFRNLVDAGTTFEGKTVKLGVDIDLAGINFDPIGYNYVHLGGQAFMGTFDGANHTIYNLYQQGWDLEAATGKDYTYSTAGGGLFASIKNATIKNLAISGADIKMECVDMGIVVGYAQGTCHFENIVVTNSRIANYQRATGGVVGEVCFGPYGTKVSEGYSHTFNNITVDSSVTVGSLWGDFDNLSGGVIGGKWGDATVKMTNVNVAAKLDVYSDVTAAYQWYAYRRCGMLIGHTEQNSPKSALNAAAEFLTCENVNVYYGDWVNYTYYQFTNQNNTWQNNYPWVRAQVGLNNSAFSNPRYGHPDVTIDGVSTEINTVELAEAYKTDKVTITFNQLYGGGQGVYGAADHAGVTVHNKLEKTIYIDNNLGWSNLKLEYYFANGSDRWSTIVDGADIVAQKATVYKVSLPAYAAGFRITADGGKATPEIGLNQVAEKSTYTLNAFQLSLKVEGANELLVSAGNLLYNVEISANTAPKYDVVIYDRSYAGTFATNGFGVAIVIDSNGNIVKAYDAANGTGEVYYYDANTTKGELDITNAEYATRAWSELKDGERLIIFPNDGGTNTVRSWAKALCASSSIGQKLTLAASISGHLKIEVNDVDIDGFINTHVVTENNWLYNTQVNIENYPYAAHYKALLYYAGYDFANYPFATNEYGIAIVLDADNKLVKIYDAANGDRSVVYYDANGSKVIVEAIQDSEAEAYSNDNYTYATRAWSELGDGEKLIVFPNHKSDNSSRDWAKELCNNWTNVYGKTILIDATLEVPKTIYFQNTQGWENVGIEYELEDGTILTGVLDETTLNDGLYDVYRVVIPANVVKVAFGSADAEGNVTVENPEITEINNGYVYIYDGENIHSCLYKSGYNTIYFENNQKWDDVYIYYWCENGNTEWDNVAFPGEEMTLHSSEGIYDVYSFNIPKYVKGFIFSNGIDVDSVGHYQTHDILLSDSDVNGKIFYPTSIRNVTENDVVVNYKYDTASVTYVEGYKTINFVNNWNWSTVTLKYNSSSAALTKKTTDIYDVYSVVIPNYVSTFKMAGPTEESVSVSLTSVTAGSTYAMFYTGTKQFIEAKKLYLKPGVWTSDNARFSAYVWNGSKNIWVDMKKIDNTYYGTYIPKSYNNVIFGRMNPSTSDNNFNSGVLWNQTDNLTYNSSKTCFQINGWSYGEWITK